MSATPQDSETPLRFGRFELRPREYRLLADGEPVALGGRAMDLLLLLAARAGELVTRNELIEHAWPGRVVEDNNLSVQIKALRKALGDQWLVTVPGRGYRLELPKADSVAGATSATAPLAGSRSRMPNPPPSLIGREVELQALQAMVDNHRLVTVLGAGGIGKTRLAQTVLHARADLHPDGVCWVELEPVAAGDAVPAAVARALGLPGAAQDTTALLARSLNGLQMLLVLDNAEHIVDAVARLVHKLLESCSDLRLLITSQAPLRLPAEHVLRLGPLGLPQTGLPALDARSFGAVALFCDRAAAADHRFVLNDADVPAVVGLCQRLGGSPLAIELAASRVPSLGVQALHATLAERLTALAGHRDSLAPPRQRSLRAALEWSVQLLPTAAARLFASLAVVAGSASLSLVQRLSSDTPTGWEVVDALDELVQRSLVELVQDEQLAYPRYRLLDAPRSLALEMLAASGEEAPVRLRHAQGMLAEYDRIRAAFRAGRCGLKEANRVRDLEAANVREAILHARLLDDRDLELALAGEAMPAASGDERLVLVDRCMNLLAGFEGQTPRDDRRHLRALRAISIALTNLQPARSEVAARQAVELARRIDPLEGDRFELYEALCALAQKLTDVAGGEESAQLLQEASRLEDAGWAIALRRLALSSRASLAMNRDGPERAVPLYRQLLDALLAAGESALEPLLNMANAELAAGDARAAVTHGQQLLDQLLGQLAAWRYRNIWQTASTNLMLAHLALGHTAPARAIAGQIWGQAKAMRLNAWSIDALAWLAAQEGRLSTAARLARAANDRYQTTADRRELNEQRAYAQTLALLAEAGAALPGPEALALSDAELIALALAQP